MTTCTCDTHTSSGSTATLTCTNTGTGEAIFAQSSGNAPGIQANSVGTGTNSHGLYAVAGANAYCVWGEGGIRGVYGKCYAASGHGVYGEATLNGGIGVYGVNGGNGFGGRFKSTAAGGTGLYSEGPSGSGLGVWGNGNYGVKGDTSDSNGVGTLGSNSSAFPSSGAKGVYAYLAGTAAGAYGLYVYGAGYVGGLLTKAGGGYYVDHPADPENKYLFHSFVESPEMLNVYRGRATLDEKGEALVDLPGYFAAACEAPEYQHTPIGAAMPMLHVAEELPSGFKLAGGAPGKQVSWTVTAKRADKWAKTNHPGVEIDKSGDEKGRYLHPSLFGHDTDHHVDPTVRATKKRAAEEAFRLEELKASDAVHAALDAQRHG